MKRLLDSEWLLHRLPFLMALGAAVSLSTLALSLAYYISRSQDTLHSQCVRGNDARAQIVLVFRAFEREALRQARSRKQRDTTRDFFERPLASLGPRNC